MWRGNFVIIVSGGSMQKNISKIKFWFGISLLAVLFIFFYGQALREYILTLVILLIAGLICKEAREIWTKGRGIKDDLFLASAAIVITILIFVLQSLQAIQDINNTLQATNKYNCSVAQELKNEILSTKEVNNISPRIKRRYATELYKTHIDYLLKKFDSKKSEVIFETIGNMDESNRFLDLSLSNFYEFPKNLLNSSGKTDFLVSFDAYAKIGKIYDNQILDLSRNVLSGLKKIDSALRSTDLCIEQ